MPKKTKKTKSGKSTTVSYLKRIQQAKNAKANEQKTKWLYSFEMEIDHQDVCNQMNELAEQLNLPSDVSLPVPLLVETHGQQDYAIAHFCNLIHTPKSWDLQVCTFFADRKGNIYEHNYECVLPGMTNSEMMLGTRQHMIQRKGGIKSQWKGLLKEVDNAYDDDKKITKHHQPIKTIFYINTEAAFLNEAAYDHFNDLLRHRDSGNLIKRLEAMERAMHKEQLLAEGG